MEVKKTVYDVHALDTVVKFVFDLFVFALYHTVFGISSQNSIQIYSKFKFGNSHSATWPQTLSNNLTHYEQSEEKQMLIETKSINLFFLFFFYYKHSDNFHCSSQTSFSDLEKVKILATFLKFCSYFDQNIE